jgi:hypothetical protein
MFAWETVLKTFSMTLQVLLDIENVNNSSGISLPRGTFYLFTNFSNMRRCINIFDTPND